jgi:hypothetical protein
VAAADSSSAVWGQGLHAGRGQRRHAAAHTRQARGVRLSHEEAIDTLSGERLTPLSPDDHPHHPVTTWHNSRSLWMLNPNLAAIQPVTIRPGAPLTLRYRVVVHDGGTPTAIIQKLSDEWRHDTGLPNPGSEWTI